MFPSLVNCCTLDWVDAWPEEALLSVSKRFLGTRGIEQLKGKDELIDALGKMCVHVHSTVGEMAVEFANTLRRKVYTTPKSFLDLIRSYEIFLAEKRGELSHRRNTLYSGLKKLEDTNREVSEL